MPELDFMRRISIHLIWAGTFVTITGLTCLAYVTVNWSNHEGGALSLIISAILALVGPPVMLVGAYIRWTEQKIHRAAELRLKEEREEMEREKAAQRERGRD